MTGDIISIYTVYQLQGCEKMFLEYKIDELNVENAWLTTLYELIEELNCKCQTFFTETYNSKHRCFSQIRTIKIRGSSSMLSWLKLRMERYSHFVNSLNSRLDVMSQLVDEED